MPIKLDSDEYIVLALGMWFSLIEMVIKDGQTSKDRKKALAHAAGRRDWRRSEVRPVR